MLLSEDIQRVIDNAVANGFTREQAYKIVELNQKYKISPKYRMMNKVNEAVKLKESSKSPCRENLNIQQNCHSSTTSASDISTSPQQHEKNSIGESNEETFSYPVDIKRTLSNDILLSVQRATYGICMYDLLTEDNKPEIQRLLNKGCTLHEASLILFHNYKQNLNSVSCESYFTQKKHHLSPQRVKSWFVNNNQSGTSATSQSFSSESFSDGNSGFDELDCLYPESYSTGPFAPPVSPSKLLTLSKRNPFARHTHF